MPISRVVRDLKIEWLRERLAYSKETGQFTWLVSGRGLPGIGKVAGSPAVGGYWRLHMKGVTYLAHRLAWFYVYEEWPKFEIDHINGNRLDNRIANLRDVPMDQNRQNQRKHHKTNKSGYFGVHFCKTKKKWRASIMYNRTQHRLGYYSTPEEAHASYIEAKRKFHPGCTI